MMEPAICTANVARGGSLVYCPSFKSAIVCERVSFCGTPNPVQRTVQRTLQHCERLERRAIAVEIDVHDRTDPKCKFAQQKSSLSGSLLTWAVPDG